MLERILSEPLKLSQMNNDPLIESDLMLLKDQIQF